MRYVAYPDPDAVIDESQVLPISKAEAEKQAEDAFRLVFEHGPKIELDHQIVYNARTCSLLSFHLHPLKEVYVDYELGRLLACRGKTDEARHQFELVLSGKYLEVGPSGRKGKYSLEVCRLAGLLAVICLLTSLRMPSMFEHTQRTMRFTKGAYSYT